MASSAAVAAPVSSQPAPSVTFNGPVLAMVYRGSALYVGGDFTEAIVNGRRFSRQRLAAVDAATGALLAWTPAANKIVRALAADSDAVYAAGDFSNVSGKSRDNLAKIDAVNGSVLATFKHSVSGRPEALAVGNGRLYLGGSLTAISGQLRSRLAAFDLSTGALDPGWLPQADDTVRSIVAANGAVYLGGRFSSVNGAKGSAKIAAVDPVTGVPLAGFTSQVSSIVHKLAVTGDSVYAAVGGAGGRATAMDLAGNARWTITTDGDVQAITVLDDVVYLGGHFDNVCNSANTGAMGVCLDGSVRRIKLAAVSPSGALLDWTANGNGSVGVNVLAASQSNGQLAAGGEFTKINGSDQPRFALFNLVTANATVRSLGW
jgi:hypothetical protein